MTSWSVRHARPITDDFTLWLREEEHVAEYGDESLPFPSNFIVNIKQCNLILCEIQKRDYQVDKEKCLAATASDYSKNWRLLGYLDGVLYPGSRPADQMQTLFIMPPVIQYGFRRTPIPELDFAPYQICQVSIIQEGEPFPWAK